MVNNRLGDDTIIPVGTQGSLTGNGTMFVCGNATNQIHRSLDGGATWDAGGLVTTIGSVHGICHLANGWLLSCTYGGVIFKSEDNGITWSRFASPSNLLASIIQLANGNLLLVDRTSGYVRKSTDNGATWDAGTNVGGTLIQQIIQLANGDVLVVALTSGKVYKSTDNGATWDAGTTVGVQIRGLCQLPNGNVLCASAVKLYTSTDNGATWDAGTATVGVFNRLYYSGGFVYSSSSTTADIFKSDDDGANWSTIGTIGSGTNELLRTVTNNLTVPTGATGVILQCASADSTIQWSTDNAGSGFLVCSQMKPVILRFDPVQTKILYFILETGETLRYQFFTQ